MNHGSDQDKPGQPPGEGGMEDRSHDLEYPRLRPVEAIPAQQDMVCLRDPQGISDKMLFLPRSLLFVVSLFDGDHSLVDIQTAYTRRFGDLLFSDKLRGLIDQLDRALFLETGRYREARERAVREYRGSPIRRATHAGTAYEADPGELSAQLDGLFAAARQAEEAGAADGVKAAARIAGLVAPHIDLRRGGACFAQAYRALRRELDSVIDSETWTFVVLGIAHARTARRFVLTAKDFETPLGALPADRALIERLAGRCTTDFFEDELAHRDEHSVEFQALFLRYLFPDRDVRIVPVLCSSREEDYRGPPPWEDPEFGEFCSALKEVISGRKNICLVAGVDLSHLGRRFGQDIQVDDRLLRWAREQDMAMIERVLRGDARGFMRGIMEEGDRRNVCGTPALHTLLTVLPVRGSRLIMYDQAVDRQAHSVVTFMGAALY